MAGWLVGWLTDWLSDSAVVCMMDWLIGCLADGVTKQNGWLRSQLTHRLNGRMTGRQAAYWLICCSFSWLLEETTYKTALCYKYMFYSLFSLSAFLLVVIYVFVSFCLFFFPLELHRKRPPKTVTSSFQTAVSTLQHVLFSLCTQCSSIKLNLIILEVFINFIRQYTKKLFN